MIQNFGQKQKFMKNQTFGQKSKFVKNVIFEISKFSKFVIEVRKKNEIFEIQKFWSKSKFVKK